MTTLRLAAGLAAIALLHGPTAQAQPTPKGDVEQQVTALSRQLIQAQTQGDVGFFEKSLADDYVGVRSNGSTETKRQFIESLSSGMLKQESFEFHELKVRAYGDTAVVNAFGTFKGLVGGKPFSGDVRTLRVWVKRKGKWQCVAFESTRVLPSPP